MRVSKAHVKNLLASLLWLMMAGGTVSSCALTGITSRSSIERTADYFRSDAASRRRTTTSRHSHRRSWLSWS